jgi:hypothetical protein
MPPLIRPTIALANARARSEARRRTRSSRTRSRICASAGAAAWNHPAGSHDREAGRRDRLHGRILVGLHLEQAAEERLHVGRNLPAGDARILPGGGQRRRLDDLQALGARDFLEARAAAQRILDPRHHIGDRFLRLLLGKLGLDLLANGGERRLRGAADPVDPDHMPSEAGASRSHDLPFRGRESRVCSRRRSQPGEVRLGLRSDVEHLSSRLLGRQRRNRSRPAPCRPVRARLALSAG